MVEVTLPVEPKEWIFRVNKRRQRQREGRGQQPARTMGRWAERWRLRSRDTITGPVTIAWTDTIGDDFIMNRARFRMRLPRIVGGQDRGLPPVVRTDARALTFYAPG